MYKRRNIDPCPSLSTTTLNQDTCEGITDAGVFVIKVMKLQMVLIIDVIGMEQLVIEEPLFLIIYYIYIIDG